MDASPAPDVAALVAARPGLSLHAMDGLAMEDVPLNAIADALGTPGWAYSAGMVRARLARLRRALDGLGAHVHYAVKANDHLAILRLMQAGGAGADVVSLGEFRRACAAGMAPADVVFSGVGKTLPEIEAALAAGVGQVNLESAAELDMVAAAAARTGTQARVALRINPDVDAGTLAQITTGRADNKFGIPYQEVPALYARAAAMAGILPVGLAVHIGSQVSDMAAYRAAFLRLAEVAAAVRTAGHAIAVLDCGGGLGIDYADGPGASPEALAGVLRTTLAGQGARLMIEPGRWLVGPAGVLLASVVLVKGRFTVLDAAMNDLVRPAMYGAWHGIVPLSAAAAVRPAVPTDVVGPVCESTDIFARARMLPPLAAGERVAVLDAGAYGAVMSSTYNARPLAPIALVDGARWDTIRPRQAIQSLWSDEVVPDFLTRRGHP